MPIVSEQLTKAEVKKAMASVRIYLVRNTA